jgi:hypothetical protein
MFEATKIAFSAIEQKTTLRRIGGANAPYNFLYDGDDVSINANIDLDQFPELKLPQIFSFVNSNWGIAEAQNYRRIAKQAAGAPVGAAVHNTHTIALGTAAVSFFTTAETQAWCNAEGNVVSFINLQISQNRNSQAASEDKPFCPNGHELWTQY